MKSENSESHPAATQRRADRSPQGCGVGQTLAGWQEPDPLLLVRQTMVLAEHPTIADNVLAQGEMVYGP